jgi:hypothetical protein
MKKFEHRFNCFIPFILGLVLFFFTSAILISQNKLLVQDANVSIWWTNSATKVMKYDPVPKEKEGIKIYSAKNEYESFQIIILSKTELDNVIVKVSDLKKSDGKIISSENITLKKVEYVKVTKPTDEYGKKDYYPDPLPPIESALNLNACVNNPLWITIHTPKDAEKGDYEGKIIVTSGLKKYELPFKLTVWNFSLPEKTTIRSCFGFTTGLIKKYHNLESDEELKQVVDLYYKAFHDYRINPMSPFDLYPLKINISGIKWEGGEFVKDSVLGKTVFKIEDTDENAATEARYEDKIQIEPGKKYKIEWTARGLSSPSKYTVQMKCYDAFGNFIPYENIMKVSDSAPEWTKDSIDNISFSDNARSVSLILLPTIRTKSGNKTGTIYFSDIKLNEKEKGISLLEQGDFQVDINKTKVDIDFTQFDIAGKKYLDELGFNSFNLSLQGMGGGSFYARVLGNFAGFKQGTPEYNNLMTEYLHQLESHLEKMGWLGKEYIYWFDEPDSKDYPFVREGMEMIRKNAPRLTRFITEHAPGPDIMDVTEISFIVLHRLDKDVIQTLLKNNREFWSYLCTQPKYPWMSLFIDHDAINLRVWLWLTYSYNLKGILIWNTNYWNSDEASPENTLQNPWEDPMSYMTYYWTAYEQMLPWGNGDGRFFYPPNRNPNTDKKKYFAPPVVSQRLEILRDGIEDYEYLALLKKLLETTKTVKPEIKKDYLKLLEIPESIFKSGKEYSKNPKYILEQRKKIASAIEYLMEQ